MIQTESLLSGSLDSIKFLISFWWHVVAYERLVIKFSKKRLSKCSYLGDARKKVFDREMIQTESR